MSLASLPLSLVHRSQQTLELSLPPELPRAVRSRVSAVAGAVVAVPQRTAVRDTEQIAKLFRALATPCKVSVHVAFVIKIK